MITRQKEEEDVIIPQPKDALKITRFEDVIISQPVEEVSVQDLQLAAEKQVRKIV